MEYPFTAATPTQFDGWEENFHRSHVYPSGSVNVSLSSHEMARDNVSENDVVSYVLSEAVTISGGFPVGAGVAPRDQRRRLRERTCSEMMDPVRLSTPHASEEAEDAPANSSGLSTPSLLMSSLAKSTSRSTGRWRFLLPGPKSIDDDFVTRFLILSYEECLLFVNIFVGGVVDCAIDLNRVSLGSAVSNKSRRNKVDEIHR